MPSGNSADAVAVADSVDASPQATTTTQSPQPDYVNYMDVKLQQVTGLPEDWLEAATAPSYSQHPFRYEVSLSIPPPAGTIVEPPAPATPPVQQAGDKTGKERGRLASRAQQAAAVRAAAEAAAAAVPMTTVTFTHGRVLTPVTAYTHYIANAVAPPVPGMDEVNPLQDIPEPLEVPGGTDLAAMGTAVMANTDNVVAQPAPAILWVVNEATDAPPPPPVPDTPHTRRKRKTGSLSNNGGTTGTAAAAMEAAQPLPQLPEKNDPPPCVLRVPLDAEQETHIKTLLNDNQPLVLRFKRVLRPGVPADWEDLNAAYYNATIPISLTPFSEPGSLALESRVSFIPPSASALAVSADHDRSRKKTSSRRAKSGIPPTLYEDPDPQQPHPYTTAETSAVVSISLQHTLSRLVIDRVRPNVTPQQLIPTRARTGVRPATAADATTEVKAALEVIARKILRDFKGTIAASSTNGKSAALHADATVEERDAWRIRFLEFFQSTGQLAAYKEQLTPLVVRLVHERFLREPKATRESVSELSNELYVYLLECMHATLRRLVGEETLPHSHTHPPPGTDEADPWKLRAEEAEASREYALAATYHQARIASCVENNSEMCVGVDPLLAVWTDAGNFYVRVGDAAKAEQCFREAIACDPLHLPALIAYGMLLLAYNRLGEAAVFLHGAADVAPHDSLVWGCIALLDDLYMLSLQHGSPTYTADFSKWQKERHSAMQQAIQWSPHPEGDAETSHTHTQRSVPSTMAGTREGPAALLEEQTDAVSSAEESVRDGESAASPITAVSSEGRQSCTTNNDDTGATPTAFEGSETEQREEEEEEVNDTPSAEEKVCIDVARYAILLHHHDLAGVCLAHCGPSNPIVEHLYARLFVQAQQYEDAILTLNGIETNYPALWETDSPVSRESMIADELRVLRAESEEELGQEEAAILSYKRALCKANQTEIAPYVHLLRDGIAAVGELADSPAEVHRYHRLFAGGYLRLGNLLLGAGKFKDALGVFTLGIQAWPCSLMWLGAGVAYYRMGALPAAEECLNESSILNPLNPRTWAYLALLCLRIRPAEVETMVQQVMVEGLADAPLWAELGRELLMAAGRPQLSEVCLRKAVALCAEGVATVSTEEERQRQRQLGATCGYHLAHALTQMHRYEEARTMLIDVITNSSNEVLKAKAEIDLHQLRAEM